MAEMLRGAKSGLPQARRHSTSELAFSCPFGYEKTLSMVFGFQQKIIATDLPD